MSSIKLDHVPGRRSTETVFSDPALFHARMAAPESFDDHLQRARTRPDEGIPIDLASAAVEAVQPFATDPQPAREERPPVAEASADFHSDKDATGQTSFEEAADHDQPGTGRVEQPAMHADQQGQGEIEETESEAQQRQPANDGDLEAGEAEGVLQPGQPPPDPALQAEDDLPEDESEKNHKKGLRHATSKREVENAAAEEPAVGEELTRANESHSARQQAAAKKSGAAKTSAPAEESAGGGDSSKQLANEEILATDPTAADAGKGVGQEMNDDHHGDRTLERPTGNNADAAAATNHGCTHQQDHGMDVGRPRRGEKKGSTTDRIAEGAPQRNTPNVATTEAKTTTQVNAQMVSAEPTDLGVDQRMEAADGTGRSVSGGGMANQSGTPVRVSANPASPTDSPERPAGESEFEGQVDRVRFVRRVARAFQAMARRSGSVRLRLSPPELGSLRLEISVRNGMMSVRAEAETNTARNLLLDNLPMLRERLAQQEIKVQQFSVDLADRSPGGPSDRTADQAPSHQQGGSSSAGRASTEADEETQSTRNPVAVNRPGEGARLNVVI